MSTQYNPTQIAQQNATFKQALADKTISQAQYDSAMRTQNANLAAYNAANPPQATPTQQPTAQTILDERAVFESAHQSGRINDAEYSHVMQFNQQQLTNVGYNVTPTYDTNSAPAPRPTSDFVGPMPPTKITSFSATPIPTPTPTPTPQPTAPLSIGEQIANFNPAKFGAQLGADIFSAITGKDVPKQKVEQFGNALSGVMGSGIPAIDIISVVKDTPKGTPTQVVGNMVSSVESPVYAVGGLVGVKNLPRPKTASGALVSSGIESILSLKPTESQEYKDMNAGSPASAAGSIAGDIFLGLLGGEVIKAVSPTVSKGIEFLANKNIPILSKGIKTAQGVEQKVSTATAKIVDQIPIPKYGETKVPFEPKVTLDSRLANTGLVDSRLAYKGIESTAIPEAQWKGLYLSKGSEAYPLIGKTSNIAKNGIIKEGFMPASNLETAITQKVMTKAGYSAEEISNVKNVRGIINYNQNVNSRFIEDMLPQETNTLSKQGVTVVKNTVLENKPQVKELYGSFANKPQLSKEFEFKLDGKSALREPGDIDIQLTTKKPLEAQQFAENLTTKLKGAGENVRISSKSPTLIESYKQGEWNHAVDIHYANEPTPDVLTPSKGGAEMRWGFKVERPTTNIENIDVMSANEQGIRKGSAVLEFQSTEQKLGTKDWRGKDVPDFLQTQKTLNESRRLNAYDKIYDSMTTKNPIKSFMGKRAAMNDISAYTKTNKMLGAVQEHYGVTMDDLAATPKMEMPMKYSFKAPKSVGSPAIYNVASSTLIHSPAVSTVKSSPSIPISRSTPVNYGYVSPKVSTPIQANYGYTSPKTSSPASKPIVSNYFYSPKVASNPAYSPTITPAYPSSPATKTPSYSPVFKPSPIISPSPYYSPSPSPSPYYPSPSPVNNYYPSYPSSPKSGSKKPASLPSSLGSKAMENGSNGFNPLGFGSIRSVKRKYNITTASEFLGV